AFGCYRLALPEGTWVDVYAAAADVEQAEASRSAADWQGGRALSIHSCAALRRPVFSREDGRWIERKRRELAELLVRALECHADASLATDHPEEAVRCAEEVTALEPFRESGYRLLMRANVAAGNEAEALRVYKDCRRLLAE